MPLRVTEEPDERIVHVRICGGDGGKPPSLPGGKRLRHPLSRRAGAAVAQATDVTEAGVPEGPSDRRERCEDALLAASGWTKVQTDKQAKPAQVARLRGGGAFWLEIKWRKAEWVES